MPRPMIIGMSPSRSYPEQAWDERAESTRFLAKVILKSEDRVEELKRLFKMTNLNHKAPDNEGRFASYDKEEARQTLKSLAQRGELDDRYIILLGDKVTKSFDKFMGSRVAKSQNRWVSITSDTDMVECKALSIRHPSYFVTKIGKNAGEMLAKIARARAEIEPPLGSALGVAHLEDQSIEAEKVAEAREQQIEAEFNVWLSNEDYDRRNAEEHNDYQADQGDQDDIDEELAEEFDRYERLIEGGWEED